MNNFLQRTITGAVYVAIIVLGTVMKLAFPVVFAVLLILSLFEFYKMVLGRQQLAKWLPGIIVSVHMFFCAWWFTEETALFLPVLIFMAMVAGLYANSQLFGKQGFFKQNVQVILFGIFYIGLPFVMLPYLELFDGVRWQWLLTLLVVIWVYDSFAYIFGVSFGKHRLYEKISPKKSWEGALGGTLTTLLLAFLANTFGWMPQVPEWQFVLFAFVIVIAATLGDLIESMIKRIHNVKDSGNLLPGHGGFFDRLDSFIFAVPVLMLILLIVSNE